MKKIERDVKKKWRTSWFRKCKNIKDRKLNLSKSPAVIWGKFEVCTSEAAEELITAAFTGYIGECQPRLFDDTSTSVAYASYPDSGESSYERRHIEKE